MCSGSPLTVRVRVRARERPVAEQRDAQLLHGVEPQRGGDVLAHGHLVRVGVRVRAKVRVRVRVRARLRLRVRVRVRLQVRVRVLCGGTVAPESVSTSVTRPCCRC